MSNAVVKAGTAMNEARIPVRRRGRWTYGDHAGLNPGWRLDGTNLVLDYDPLSGGCSIRGAYVLWREGLALEPIDHYVEGAMAWVENNVARYLPPPAEPSEQQAAAHTKQTAPQEGR